MSIFKTNWLKILGALFFVFGFGIGVWGLVEATEYNPRVLGTKIALAKPVEIIDNGRRLQGESISQTIPGILLDLGVQVFPEDLISAIPDPALGLGTKIIISRATLVKLDDGGNVSDMRTRKETVAEFLAEKNINLGSKDRLEPTSDTKLISGMTIKITRIEEKEEKVTLAIPFDTEQQADPSMYVGNTKITRAGQIGEKEVTYKVTYENGREVKREKLAEKILSEPVNRIVAVGTKPKPRITVGCASWAATILEAATRYGVDPNEMCRCMMLESGGNQYAVNPAGYYGLFQYSPGTWADFSSRAGYGGANIYNGEAQIYVTAWAWANGYRGRWPNT